MFNPKNNNILDQELAVSGLEMNILGAIGAVAGIAQAGLGIASAASASSANSAAAKAQNKLLKQQARLTNKFNKEKFELDKEHFIAMREYNFETALTNWRYQQEIQDYEYDTQVRMYNRDQKNLKNVLKANTIAAQQAYVSEQRVIRDATTAQTFARTDNYVNALRTAGRAALGQAGRSADRAVAMTAADHGRNLAILDASFSSSIEQHEMNMFDIALNKFGADLNAEANAMLKPERLPDLPMPTRPPLPEFVEPLKIKPGKVSSPSGTGSIIGAIGQGLSTLAPIAGQFGAQLGSTPTPVPGG